MLGDGMMSGGAPRIRRAFLRLGRGRLKSTLAGSTHVPTRRNRRGCKSSWWPTFKSQRIAPLPHTPGRHTVRQCRCKSEGAMRLATPEIDPVCGMEVDAATAMAAHRDCQAFHFCSDGCRLRFLNAHTAQPDPGPPGDEGAACCGHSKHSGSEARLAELSTHCG